MSLSTAVPTAMTFLDHDVRRTDDVTPLAERLAAALARREVRYCQWKGRVRAAAPHDSSGDIDLLVDRRHARAFAAAADALGFRLALAPPAAQVPGVVSYLGADPETDRLVHVHVHYHLVLGRMWATPFRLPIEDVVLGTAVEHAPFPAPAPEFELLLMVLQETLKQAGPGALGRRAVARRWMTRAVLHTMERDVGRGAVLRALAHCVHDIDLAFFDRCRDTLRRDGPLWRRWLVRRALERRLRAHAYRSGPGGFARRLVGASGRLVGLAAPAGNRPASGGLIVALVGADGAGKSTCAGALTRWLATGFREHWAHLGRPPSSLTTLVVGALLRALRWLETRAGRRDTTPTRFLELVRYLCTARDRYRAYRRVRRVAAGGGIAICERYPIRENRFLVGPSLAQRGRRDLTGPLAEFVRRRELSYYGRIAPPDLVLVLRVDPDVAVARKHDEPPDYVRQRAQWIAETDWSRGKARIVDANRPLPQVLAELRTRVWDAL